MACLTVLDGSLKGQRFTLTLPLTRIGRREGNDWVVQDGSISGTHCEIEKSDDGFLIRDLGSTNGTKVNNVTIKEKALSRNDIILLGEVPMMIEGAAVGERVRCRTANDHYHSAETHPRNAERVRQKNQQQQALGSSDRRAGAGDCLPLGAVVCRRWCYRRGRLRSPSTTSTLAPVLWPMERHGALRLHRS